MIAIRVRDKLLDLFENTTLGWAMQNTVFAGDGSDALPGTYYFPLSVPATAHNRALLGRPGRATTPGQLLSEEPAELHYGGSLLFPAPLRVLSATEREIRIQLIANPLRKLSDTTLASLDLGGERSIGGNDTARFAHMLDTLKFPDQHDYSFVPIYAPNFRGSDPVTSPIAELWQNQWNINQLATGCLHNTPFVRIEYLLRRLVESIAPDWTFINAFQNTSELRRLYLHNLYAIRRAADTTGGTPQLPSTINLQNHVSDTKGNEFLRKMANQFCLGVFTDPFERRIALRPLREVLSRPPRHDWTARALAGIEVAAPETSVPKRFRHQPVDSTLAPAGVYAVETYDRRRSALSLPGGSIPPDGTYFTPDGIYYTSAEEMLWEIRTPAGGGSQTRTRLGRVRRGWPIVNPSGEGFESPLGVLYMEAPPVGGMSALTPAWFEQGSHVKWNGSDWERSTAKNSDTVFFYRGIEYDSQWPCAGTDIHSPLAAAGAVAKITDAASVLADAQYSLLWPEPQGLYNQWWRDWHRLLTEGKRVSRQFRLSVADLRQFRLEDQIRVDNMAYFVKSLRVTLTMRGIAPVEAELISVV